MESEVKRNSSCGSCGFEEEEKKKKESVYESVTESGTESRESRISYSSYDAAFSDEVKKKVDNVGCDLISQSSLGWLIRKAEDYKTNLDDSKFKGLISKFSEIDMMKEKFAKLLLGEDMSGSGKGVCTALAISNAITNLYVAIFGQLWRLEPLPSEKKSMWIREMKYLLCVGDHIVELIPTSQTIPGGTKLEVMTCRQRSDLLIDLPALRKLDNMLLEILDSFANSEFWYVDQGIIADGSTSCRETIQRQEENWWLPVPRVPAGGLSENSKKKLNHTRKITSQIRKAAKAINSIALTEMNVPDSYLEKLPKKGRACLGDMILQYISSVQFSSECLLDCLDVSTEVIAIEIANRLESAIHVWRRRAHSKHPAYLNRSKTRSPWNMVKDMMVDADKRELLAERAESLLLLLKQRFPGLSQTILDSSKIRFNKDVGKSIIESYSRILESLAYNIVARIDDLLYVDGLIRHSDKLSRIPYSSVPVSGTPFLHTTPGSPLVSPASGERTPFLDSTNRNKPHHCGFGMKFFLERIKKFENSVKGTGMEGRNNENWTAK